MSRRWIITLAVVLYAAFLIRGTPFGVAGSDSTGYMNAARLLSKGQLEVRVAPLDVMGLDDSWRVTFMPLGFSQIPRPRVLAPSYPLGYPAHLMLFGVVGGWDHAPYYVTPLTALLTLLVLYKLARELGIADGLALGGALILALSPAWDFQALQPMSDVPAAMWCAVTILCAVRSQRDWRWAAACGAAFGVAVWVRPTNLLLALAIGFAMRWRIRSLAIAVGASMPFAIALMLVNRHLYGSAFMTGYGGMGSLMTRGSCGPHHALWLMLTLTPLIFPLSLFAFFTPRVPLWQRLTLVAWFVPFFAFYSSYAICDAWWYLRFLLPAYAPLILCFLLMLREFVRSRTAQAVLVAIVAVTGIWFIEHFDVPHLYEGQRTDMHAVHWSQKILPKNALVCTMQISGAYYYYTQQFPARYDYIDPARFEELRAYAGSAGLHWYALVYDWEEKDLLEHMPGRWTKVDTFRNVLLLRLDS